jgi:hypothetical protein
VQAVLACDGSGLFNQRPIRRASIPLLLRAAVDRQRSERACVGQALH